MTYQSPLEKLKAALEDVDLLGQHTIEKQFDELREQNARLFADLFQEIGIPVDPATSTVTPRSSST